jgi:hypothetical protein
MSQQEHPAMKWINHLRGEVEDALEATGIAYLVIGGGTINPSPWREEPEQGELEVWSAPPHCVYTDSICAAKGQTWGELAAAWCRWQDEAEVPQA